VRIATYNVHGWVDAEMAPNATRVVSLLRKIDADVIALQEVTRGFGFDVPDDWYDSDEELAPGYVRPDILEVASALRMHAVIAPAGWGANVLLARQRPVDTRSLSIGDGPGGRRSAAIATIATPMGDVDFVATHLDPASESARVTQLRNLATVVGDRKAVIMGDFNAIRFSDYSQSRLYDIARERREAGVEEPSESVIRSADALGWIDLARLAVSDSADDYYRSLSSPMPRKMATTSNFGTRVDYVWATRSLVDAAKVRDARTFGGGVSDHRAVALTITSDVARGAGRRVLSRRGIKKT
jgi:endonuclease/exonuclease/phosphatase family metal-dependent hydrolase